MPELPGKHLSQAHFDRVVASFPGESGAEKAAAYDDWLTNRLIERVQQVEAQRIRIEMDNATQMALAQVTASLPPLRPEPPLAIPDAQDDGVNSVPGPDAVP